MPDPSVLTATETRHERTESARLDNFVDGAFAFAITLLVISGASLPRNIASLEHALRGVPAFAACFALLAWFWHAHVRWRDTVGRTDRTSLMLSLLLVFFALIFVFPLHLVFASAFNGLSHGALSPDASLLAATSHGVRALFTCYGIFFTCMAGTLTLLYLHGALSAPATRRDEIIALRMDVVVWGYSTSIGALSTLLALTLPSRVAGLPGFIYCLLALTGLVVNRYRAHLTRKLPP